MFRNSDIANATKRSRILDCFASFAMTRFLALSRYGRLGPTIRVLGRHAKRFTNRASPIVGEASRAGIGLRTTAEFAVKLSGQRPAVTEIQCGANRR